jgi:uncharacterized protein
MSASRVWVFGGSVRAAARALHLDGFTVYAADKFHDQDLCRYTAKSYLLPHAEHALKLIEQHAAHAWLYTGGWENHPHVIELMSQRLPLWGNQPAVLAQVRNVMQLHSLLAKYDFHMPAMQQHYPTHGDWLCKSKNSVGGVQIHRVNSAHTTTVSADHYFQAFIPGQVYGAAYIGTATGAILLGVSQQLMPCSWTNAPEFYYAGSIGPIRLLPSINQRLQQLGHVLVRETALRGWFGVDFIINEHNEIFILEVNPRYTASIEVLERAAQCSTARLHAQACVGESLHVALLERIRQNQHIVGKAIYYGKHSQPFPHAGKAAWQQLLNTDTIADIPHPDTPIETGVPYCTLFATGNTAAETEQHLQQFTCQVSQILQQN